MDELQFPNLIYLWEAPSQALALLLGHEVDLVAKKKDKDEEDHASDGKDIDEGYINAYFKEHILTNI